MIIRFEVGNVLSFDEDKEFNMLPMPKYRRLDKHKYSINDFDILKLAAIYGANGAGKSNLIKALAFLQDIVTEDKLPKKIKNTRFKFNANAKQLPQNFTIEFFQENIAFYYGVTLLGDSIQSEALYLSGLGRADDKLIFERTSNAEGQYTLKFLDKFEADTESRVLKSVIEKNLIKPYQTLLKLLPTLNNSFLGDVAVAYKWFEETLRVVYPDSKPSPLAHRIDIDSDFKRYAEDIMCAFNIGITKLQTKKQNIREFLGHEDEELIENLVESIEASPNKMISLVSSNDDLVFAKENDDYFVKQLQLSHCGKGDLNVYFDLEEESDGTIRLLDFIPAFSDLLNQKKVYVIDEIERSIHPLLIKELVSKFSFDEKTAGQLIFTTHESNLLDQDIFRQDEIWFAEKNSNGSTDLYSLSDFKEHNTIDIKKGYLNGRYGSIPFLGNLKDLNWHNYDSKEQ